MQQPTLALAMPLPRRSTRFERLFWYAVIAMAMSFGGTSAAWPAMVREYGLLASD